MRALLAVALVLLAASAGADVFTAAAIAGAAGDIVTTEVGLRRGFVEQNIQQPPAAHRDERAAHRDMPTGGAALQTSRATRAGPRC